MRAQPVRFPSLPLSPLPFNPPLPPHRQKTNQKTNTKSRRQFLWFPCGIIRGALASMGINATVQAETAELPGATFQIKSVVVKP